MTSNKYVDDEAKNITYMIKEFATLTEQIGVKTTDDVERICRWYNLKEILQKKKLIKFK